MTSIDIYLATLTPEQRTEFERIRKIVQETVPDIEEGTSYAMPAYMYKGKGVLSAMVNKNFLSIYPFSGKVTDKLLDKLKAYDTSPGTIRFSLENTLPEGLIKEIVAARIQEIEEKVKN